MSRGVTVSTGDLSVVEFELEFIDGSAAVGGIDMLAFFSRNRRLFGGKESISDVAFIDGFVFAVELLVLLPSPAPVLEQELASS